MGRHAKKITNGEGLDRRETGYYSTPKEVAEFIAHKTLEYVKEAKAVLDPCVGKGELVEPFLNKGLSVTGLDVLDFDDRPRSIDFTQNDFLEYYETQKHSRILGQRIDLPYDILVANPPYNCHEVDYIRDRKARLSSLFGDVGVLNMYSMFLAAMIDCAKDGTTIGAITFDSFLTARGHAGLREQILNHCSIHYLLLCPTDLFLDQGADVRTCILILQKGRGFQGPVAVANRPLDSTAFFSKLKDGDFARIDKADLVLSGKMDNNEFVVGAPAELLAMFKNPRLGELFDCVTGISTGNDKKYLHKEAKPGASVPFFKNPGSRRFYTTPDAFLPDDFLEIDKQVSNFMVRNKRLLFQPGIACSSMGVAFGAAYLPPDSAYGVNANIIVDEKDLWWLLAFLNSSLVTYLVRGIIIRSNMITAGYVQRIPMPSFSDRAKEALASVAKEAHSAKIGPDGVEPYVLQINNIVYEDLEISATTIAAISEFTENLIRST